jgi:predicted DNA-binding protein (MmcQ/YjbR family)
LSPDAFRDACLGLPAATLTVQWGDTQVFKVGGRMFALMGGAVAQDGISLKVSDLAYEVLVETGRAVPAPYLARARWVRFSDLATLDEAEVRDWLHNAHRLVVARLTRAVRRELGLEAAITRPVEAD